MCQAPGLSFNDRQDGQKGEESQTWVLNISYHCSWDFPRYFGIQLSNTDTGQ